MTKRRYYSVRTGKNPNSRLEYESIIRLFFSIFNDLWDKGYFQEAFGYECVDAGEVPGSLGNDIEAFFIRTLRKTELWPIFARYEYYSEDDLFDVIELLYDHISYPVDGFHHTYCDCGWHYDTFDRDAGKTEFRTEINDILRDYGEGYQLSENGEIHVVGPIGSEELLNAPLPDYDKENVNRLVELAIKQYQRSRSSLDERRDAVRNLGDVLEYLDPKGKKVLSKSDSSDLFNILNKFGIRHHNDTQKTDYEQAIFLSWLFYHYLAAIHAVVRLIELQEE